MRAVPDIFITAIRKGSVKVCEIYEFELITGQIYRYTNHGDDIDWGSPSKRYTSLPLQRASISHTINLETGSVEFQLAGITSQLFNAAMQNKLDNVKVTVRRILFDQNSASGMEFTVFVGYGTPSFNRNIISLDCSSIIDSLNIQVPKNNFQQPCNYTVFDTGCTLNKVSFKQSSVATGDAVDAHTIIDATFTPPPSDPNKYNLGELRITSGDNAGCRRCILNTEPALITVSVPFYSNVVTGTTFDYYPGCDGTPGVCRDRFANHENFYGFIYLPQCEEYMT